MRNYVIVGLGRFGASVAQTLTAEKCSVLALDADMDRVQDLADALPRVARCDGTDLESLQAVGAGHYGVGIVSIRNLEVSILTVLNLKKLGIKTVVAKAASESHGLALTRCGADRVVYPHREMGVRIAHNLVSASVVDYLEVSPGVGMVEVTAPPRLVGKTLQDLALPQLYHVQVLAINRGHRMVVGPQANETIRTGDILVLIGSWDGIRTLEEAL